ncbi:hypothetical protein HGRIS_008524 [Hohenbuehelia grisea]|uniref:Uncharacterized protein n=1 Tax=Hohenbuehelia grisea TaxID=104357 RepID=A0ABR3J894_9AGAR
MFSRLVRDLQELEGYDVDSARELLIREITDRNKNDIFNAYQLCLVGKDGNLSEDNVEVIGVGEPGRERKWVLTYTRANQQNPQSAPEEVVLSVQGVLKSTVILPPFKDTYQSSVRRVRYLKQGVTVTGLGTQQFDDAMNGITYVMSIFARSAEDGNILPSDGFNLGDNPSTLDVTNRYLTPVHERQPGDQSLTLAKEIDPLSTLNRFISEGEYVYGEDNQVLYFIKTNKETYVPAKPSVFRAGDIVEVQLSFAMIKIKNGNFKLQTILRAIMLLDRSITQKALLSMYRSKPRASASTPVSAKRRLVYERALDDINIKRIAREKSMATD